MRLVWDKTGERFYETGVDRGVVYPQVAGAYPKGAAWNGLTGVSENPSGAEATAIYADNIKYLSLQSAEDYGFSITAYMYPDEFGACNGEGELVEGVTVAQQIRKAFGLSYRTLIGNDTEGNDHGYKLHLVYGALASPSQKDYGTVNDSPEAMELSWDCTTTPVSVKDHKPTAHLIIDSTKVDAEKLAALEDILYGKDADVEARLPLPDEVVTLMSGTTGV